VVVQTAALSFSIIDGGARRSRGASREELFDTLDDEIVRSGINAKATRSGDRIHRVVFDHGGGGTSRQARHLAPPPSDITRTSGSGARGMQYRTRAFVSGTPTRSRRRGGLRVHRDAAQLQCDCLASPSARVGQLLGQHCVAGLVVAISATSSALRAGGEDDAVGRRRRAHHGEPFGHRCDDGGAPASGT